MQKGFEEEGFAVDVAYYGEDGLYFAQNNVYDAIVLDIMLPIIDGISLLKNSEIKTIQHLLSCLQLKIL